MNEPDQLTVVDAYLDHLTDADLALLASREIDTAGSSGPRAYFRRHPERLEHLLSSRDSFEAVFSERPDTEPLLGASPFLVFALCVHRGAVELQSSPYVVEWTGPGRRTPVFDVQRLLEFVSAPRRRLFLAELLASYTHVSSGSVVQMTRRGLRRQRYSELDPVRMVGLLDVVPDEARPGILRRLGDLALFLTGVFPDHLARRGFGPVEESRLLRSGGLSGHPTARGVPIPAVLGPPGPVDLLEQLGRRWYRAAFGLLPRPVPTNLLVLGELPEHFGEARRVLSLVTERFLFSHRDRWFGAAGG